MQKRGQVTVFVIMALVVLIVLALLFFGREEIRDKASTSTNVGKKLEVEMSSIEKEIKECLTKESVGFIQKISERGGYLEPVKSMNYKGKNLAILCQNVPGKDYCVNGMFSVKDLELRMNKYLEDNLVGCLTLSGFSDDYELEKGEFQVNTEILKNNIILTLKLPVKLRKENLEQKETGLLILSVLKQSL